MVSNKCNYFEKFKNEANLLVTVFFQLPTAASLQAKKGCYRRPEPSSLTTNLPPRTDFKHPNKCKMNLFTKIQVRLKPQDVCQAFPRQYLPLKWAVLIHLVWHRLGLVFGTKLCPFSQCCLCEGWVQSAPLGLTAVLHRQIHGGRHKQTLTFRFSPHCGFIFN